MKASIFCILLVAGLSTSCEYYRTSSNEDTIRQLREADIAAVPETATESQTTETSQDVVLKQLQDQQAQYEQQLAQIQSEYETANAEEKAKFDAEKKALEERIAELEKKEAEIKEQTGTPVVEEAQTPEITPTPQNEPTKEATPARREEERAVASSLLVPAVPVSRYYNGSSGDHFFTIHPENESVNGYSLENGAAFYAYAVATDRPGLVPILRWKKAGDDKMHFYATREQSPVSGFDGEGVAFYAYSPSSIPNVDTAPVFRLYNNDSGDHHYTIDPAERDRALAVGYIWEGIAWYAPSTQPVSNIPVPVYRYFGGSDHFYTTSVAEGIRATDYRSEGIAFKAYNSPKTPTSVPIYRFYNNNSGDHFYTKSSTTPAGYAAEGIAFYCEPAATAEAAAPLYRRWKSPDHFYTLDPDEGTGAGYVTEEILCYVSR